MRIPWAVEAEKGWPADRRPNANMVPYLVTGMIIETCGGGRADEAAA